MVKAVLLQTLYLEILKKEGVVQTHNDEISSFDKVWFEDALNTIAGLSAYGPPMYFELASFKQIQATGLQITKSPGKDVVYFGSAMLIIGVFFLFYVRQRRVWIHIKPNTDIESDSSKAASEVTIAAKDNRDLPETTTEFNGLVNRVKKFNNNNTNA